MPELHLGRRAVTALNILKWFANADVRAAAYFTKWHDRGRTNPQTILYESRDGQSMTDAPYAVFLHLLSDTRFKGFTHIWCIRDERLRKRLQVHYRGSANVKFVDRGTKPYLRALATAGFLFNNSTFPHYFLPHSGQVYVNTWHGTPLKHMGFRLDQPGSTQNVLRNLLHTNYIISPNRHTTDVFRRDYKLDGCYQGTILEVGSPRSDLTLRSDIDAVREKVQAAGLMLDAGRKLVLYAPTWKGTDLSRPRNDVDRILADLRRLEEDHGNRMQFLVKLHPYLYREVSDHPDLQGLLIPDEVDPNEVLAITDILMTDYSSMFFDFLVTDRPILFYMWDSHVYRSTRDLYIEPDALPGPVAESIDEVSAWLTQIADYGQQFGRRHAEMKSQFCPKDDGGSTERIVEAVFLGARDEAAEVKCGTDKTRLLFYPGSMKNNGITESFLALMEAIDHTRFDVSILWKPAGGRESAENLKRMNAHVRQLFSPGRANRRLVEAFREQWTLRRGRHSSLDSLIYPSRFYAREARRCLADAQFECVIDFSGYSMHWASILDSVCAGRRIIYMHNDMLAEMDKVINGRRVHYHAILGLTSIYSHFDAIVNVSEGQRLVNQENLAGFAPSTAFVTVSNPVNTKRVIEGAGDRSNVFQRDGADVLVSGLQQGVVNSVPLPRSGDFTLVNIGRLSPEKGQLELLEAFAQAAAHYPHARLYIIGDGVLHEWLSASIDSYGLSESAFLVGHLQNPFFLLSQADAFVLSSHYEGQGLVLLEAMMLGVPVVSTDIPSSRSVLEEGKLGLLVGEGVEGLRWGIEQAVQGRLPVPNFDAAEYNARAMDGFYEVIAGNARDESVGPSAP